MITTTDSDPSVVTNVFVGLDFPAARWEIVTCAPDYGLGGRALDLLWDLQPVGTATLEDLVRTMTEGTVHDGRR